MRKIREEKLAALPDSAKELVYVYVCMTRICQPFCVRAGFYICVRVRVFLDASSHLYKRVCPFVCPSVCPSVH